MIRARLLLPLFTQGDVQSAVDGLTTYNRRYLATHTGTPRLYASSVRYQRERGGRPEEWQSIPYALASGLADCEDLAAWRAAEIPGARAVVLHSSTGYHVVVRRPDGTTEDPSRKLGM